MRDQMSSTKSAKELAYLHDLYVATDWSDRFAKLIDETIALPDEGQFLYVECGTGSHALALREKIDEEVDFFATESDEERLRIAQSKAQVVNGSIRFQNSHPHKINFPNATFGTVVCDASFINVERLLGVWEEIHRILEREGNVALVLPTAGSFGQFFSVFWEALHNLDMDALGGEVERLITELPHIFDVEDVAKNAGFEKIETNTTNEIFEFETGGDFLRSPLIEDFLFPLWTEFVPDDKQVKLLRAIERVINEARNELSFRLSVKMTLVTARKA